MKKWLFHSSPYSGIAGSANVPVLPNKRLSSAAGIQKHPSDRGIHWRWTVNTVKTWSCLAIKRKTGRKAARGNKWCISRVQGTFRQWNCYSVWCKYICHYIFVKWEICNTKSKLQYKLWNLVNNNVLILADQFHKYTTPMQEANNTEKWGWVQEYMGCLCI